MKRIIIISFIIILFAGTVGVSANWKQIKFTWDEHQAYKRALKDGMWHRIADEEASKEYFKTGKTDGME